MKSRRVVRALVVDDSALVRRVLSEGLAADPEIQVVGTASNPYEARDILVIERPDVVTLDIEMPRMDGITFLKKYMAVIPTPTVVVSNLTTGESRAAIAALDAGAVDVLAKPRLIGNAEEATRELCQRVKAAALVDTKTLTGSFSKQTSHMTWGPGVDTALIALGASTGGVKALSQLLSALPADAPPIIIGQHMPEGFTAGLAERLNEVSRLEVLEARQGMLLAPGRVIVSAANDRHTEVRNNQGRLHVTFSDGQKDCFQRPAINVLFKSIAACVTGPKAGVLLTGMGADGAEGLLQLRRSGGHTVCQDEASSVVYGMPQAAWKMGAAEEQHALDQIPGVLLKWFRTVSQRGTRGDTTPRRRPPLGFSAGVEGK